MGAPVVFVNLKKKQLIHTSSSSVHPDAFRELFPLIEELGWELNDIITINFPMFSLPPIDAFQESDMKDESEKPLVGIDLNAFEIFHIDI